MLTVVHDDVHGIASVVITGDPTAEEFDSMTEDLKKMIGQDRASRVIFQVNHFFGAQAEKRLAETLFKHLAVDVTKDAKLKRIAVVGEPSWKQWVSGVLRPVAGASVRYFPADRLEEAWSWLHADVDT